MQAWQQEALQSMGLSLLEPRFDFPAAGPSVQLWQGPQSRVAQSAANAPEAALEQPVSKAASTLQAPKTKVETAAQATQASALSMLAELGVTAAEVERPAQRQSKAAALRFRLRLVRFDHVLMLLDQPTLYWQDEQLSLAFFNDIYFALFAAQPTVVSSQVFEWPPSKNYPHAQDIQQARQTFTSFTEHMFSDVGSPIVLSWGRAADFLQDALATTGQYQEQSGLQLLQLEALHHYWQSADHKRELWQQLQVIRAAH